MVILESGLVFLHLIGLAAVLGAWMTQLRADPRVLPMAMWHGILIQVVTGVALAGVVPQVDGDELMSGFYVKITIKLVLALVALGLIWANRKKPAVAGMPFVTIGLIEVVNVGLAVFWQ